MNLYLYISIIAFVTKEIWAQNLSLPPSPRFAPCDICGGGMQISNPNSKIKFPGQPEISCSTLQEVASNGYFKPDVCSSMAEQINIPCGCVITSPPNQSDFPKCSVCGEGLQIGLPNVAVEFSGQPKISCLALEVAGNSGRIDPVVCSSLVSVVKQSCGCKSSNYSIDASQLIRQPTMMPTLIPSSIHSSDPSFESFQPSPIPSRRPSLRSSSVWPSSQPSSRLSLQPSLKPSLQSSSQPSLKPSLQSSSQPSSKQSLRPSAQPSLKPSLQLSAQPSVISKKSTTSPRTIPKYKVEKNKIQKEKKIEKGKQKNKIEKEEEKNQKDKSIKQKVKGKQYKHRSEKQKGKEKGEQHKDKSEKQKGKEMGKQHKNRSEKQKKDKGTKNKDISEEIVRSNNLVTSSQSPKEKNSSEGKKRALSRSYIE